MKATKTPHRKPGGTAKFNRAERERAVASNLEWLRVNAPKKFDRAMQLLARIAVDLHTGRKVD